MSAGFSRRGFLKTGGALVISFALGPRFAPAQDAAPLPGSLNANRMLNAWLRIDSNGSVTMVVSLPAADNGEGPLLCRLPGVH
jgi:hypothetical protein